MQVDPVEDGDLVCPSTLQPFMHVEREGAESAVAVAPVLHTLDHGHERSPDDVVGLPHLLFDDLGGVPLRVWQAHGILLLLAATEQQHQEKENVSH